MYDFDYYLKSVKFNEDVKCARFEIFLIFS